jgi:electron transfer flavoprotein alpha subunit
MSNVLVVAEHQDGKLRKVTLPTITFGLQAKALTGGELYVLVLGHKVGDIAKAVASYEGVDKVFVADSPTFANYLAETWAPAVAQVVDDNKVEVVATPSTTTGKDFLPRAAALVDGGAQVSDVVAVEEGDDGFVYTRPMLAGNLLVKIASEADVTFATVRTTAFEAVAEGGNADIEELSLDVNVPAGAQFVSFEQVKSDRPELTDAAVVVAGGRGLKTRENFGMLEQLADLMGGAIGASRAAVDSGMAPNDWQIGQTGKVVAPNLYFAVAISGAIQHLAGMKGSKTIVAINKDGDAPIFQVSDYGLVADAFVVVPELTRKIKALG